MVDLHQTEPGLPTGHPWLALGRWGMAWRAWAGVLTSTALGLMIMDLATPSNGGPISLINSIGLWVLGGAPLVAAIAVLVLGPWLRRYYPFSQGLLLGGICAAAVGGASLILGIVEAGLTGSGSAWIVACFICPPLLVACAAAYPMAIWSTTSRGARVCWPILGFAVVAYAVSALVVTAG